MRLAFDPGARPPAVEARLGELPVALFDDELHYCAELVARYATDLALEISVALELEPALRRGVTLAEAAASLGAGATFRPALAALLERLVAAGEISASDSPRRYRATAPLRRGETAELRRLGVAVDRGIVATLDLLDAAAAIYPAVAAGRTSAERELLGPRRLGLWTAYFSNANRLYALGNRIAALAAAARLPCAPLRLLEVGAGAGSAALTLLEELERRGRLAEVALYDLTEPNPAFRRRAERALAERFPGVTVRSRALDLDLPLAAQARPGSYDLVYGVNVLHVARALGVTLAGLRDALRPGAFLVAGECLRPFPGQVVPADLVFELLRGFTAVEIDAELRPRHGFLDPAAWRRALAASGFDEVAVVPDVERLREHYPRFETGALCARRPPVQSP